jgi:hypothetical protein
MSLSNVLAHEASMEVGTEEILTDSGQRMMSFCKILSSEGYAYRS